MKKLVAAAAVVVVLLVVAPWGIGKLAERHLNGGLNRAIEEMPYLAIVERKYDSGWFRSEQVVTFELRSPWTDVLREVVAAEQSAEVADEPDASVVNAADGAEAPAPDTPAAASAAYQAPRFTLRSEILHGPVLWPFGFGAARVNTHIVWSDETRKTIIRVFGDDEPFKIATRVGFFGGGTTTLSSDARTIKPEEGGQVSWDDLEFNVHYSRDASEMSFDGKWPRFEAASKDDTHFLMRDFVAGGRAKRITGDLYDSDAVFRIASLRADGKGSETVEMSALEYVVETNPRKDFVDIAFRLGSGAVKLKQLNLDEVHYDFSLNRLHADSLDKLMVAVRESYTRATDETAETGLGLSPDEKKTIFALLAHDPEFAIDRISVATKAGDGIFKGVLRLKGVTEADLEQGGLALVGKLEAEFDIDIAEALFKEFGGDSATVDVAVDQGYAVRKDGRVTSRIEFKAGELKINGKTQAIPGLGGPPPGGDPVATSE